jgi:hypothetical protein
VNTRERRNGIDEKEINVIKEIARRENSIHSDAKNGKCEKLKKKEIVNSLGAILVRIEPGNYIMGSPINEEGRREDEMQHKVEIAKALYLARSGFKIHELHGDLVLISVVHERGQWYDAVRRYSEWQESAFA